MMGHGGKNNVRIPDKFLRTGSDKRQPGPAQGREDPLEGLPLILP